MVPDVLVDTGADVTQIPGWVAETLGIDLSSCKKVKISGVGGTITVYLTTLRIAVVSLGSGERDLSGYVLGIGEKPHYFEIPVIFSLKGEGRNIALLGRRGILQYLAFSFDEDSLVTIWLKGAQ